MSSSGSTPSMDPAQPQTGVEESPDVVLSERANFRRLCWEDCIYIGLPKQQHCADGGQMSRCQRPVGEGGEPSAAKGAIPVTALLGMGRDGAQQLCAGGKGARN